MKIIVYTSIIGKIDRLWSRLPGITKAEFVALVDSKKREAGTWKGKPSVINIKARYNTPTWRQQLVKVVRDSRRTARHCKVMPNLHFPDADVWIWVDGNVRLRTQPEAFIKKYLKGDLATFRHPERKDVYEEARACIRFRKDSVKVLQNQVAGYRSEGFPSKSGLAETRVIIWRNTEKNRRLGELWWAEIKNKSCRDQISFPYLCWKLGIKWNVIPGRCLGTMQKDVQYIGHRL